jgi:hypothetical protein
MSKRSGVDFGLLAVEKWWNLWIGLLLSKPAGQSPRRLLALQRRVRTHRLGYILKLCDDISEGTY